ncbi:MAG: glycosyl hydrolase [Planctomycetota bacterium]|nr:glycosyl hydrolase [Planctomycetota bacterium]
MATTNDRILLGTRKGLIEARKTNGAWRLGPAALPGQPIAYAMRDPRNGSVWASIDHGHWGVKLSRRTTDAGEFAEVEAPKYPESTGAAAKYYWVLAAGHASEPGTFWVGTEPGGLFVTRDDGATWELNEPLWALCKEHQWSGGGREGAGIHSILIDPRDAKHMHVAVSCAGICETRDGGATWRYVNKGLRMDYWPAEEQNKEYGFDPHFVALAPSAPDVLWQSNHCGVYRSADGASTWTEISEKPHAYFGFPITPHPRDANRAWIVPMHSDQNRTTFDGRLFVLRTDDGGKTWREQSQGLPQEGAMDFPYRHGMDASADGETLAFATTSGNAYVSENGGESWQTLSNNLPLVYSLRFA